MSEWSSIIIEQELDELRSERDAYRRAASEEAEDADALRAEVAELRAALFNAAESLELIVDGLSRGWWGEGSGEMELGELQMAEERIAKARAALDNKKPPA